MILSYQEALQYLYENLPMFQRVGAVAIKKDLTNTYKLCHALGDPHLAFRSVHVAGTNGKGSTCHMLASVLQAAGYKTGLYTSPHLKEFTERIKINGKEMPRYDVVDFVNRIRPLIEEVRPSFFEITVAMAFDYFAREKVDVAVVEVGLGGRLDSTNVITPLVSVITNIGLDHTDLLGETLPEIAAEKSGIIKSGVPVVVSERQSETQDVFIAKARKEHSEIFFAADRYRATMHAGGSVSVYKGESKLLEEIPFPLRGLYQERNIPAVMQTLAVLHNVFAVGDEALRDGLEHVVQNTGLKGRWQTIANRPTVICDTAHNAHGIQQVLNQLRSENYNRLFMILGMVKDKDPAQILSLLPKDANFYFCQANIPRALDAGRLQELAAKSGLQGQVIRDVNEALTAVLRQATPADLIFIGGSTYVVAELKEL